jgi:CRP/FNR family transcriptional regulator, cyclic AMP receptor protein
MSLSREHDNVCGLDEQGSRCELESNLNVLRKIPVFSGVPLNRLKLYAYLCKRRCYLNGEFIFRQGEADDRGYILLSGNARIVREYEDHSVFLNELQEGDFFGGVALLSDVKRLFSVRAATDIECLTLDRESFRKLLVQFPEVGVKVLDMMVKRIVQMEEKLMQKHVHECVYG